MTYAPLQPPGTRPSHLHKDLPLQQASHSFQRVTRRSVAEMAHSNAPAATRPGLGPASEQETCQPGGGRTQTADPAAHSNQPAAVRLHQMAATVEGYRQQAIADGIPDRWQPVVPSPESSLFCHHSHSQCSLLCKLQSQGSLHVHSKQCRPDGLFPPGDRLLQALTQENGSHPFEKHLAGLHSPQEWLPQGSWVSGNSACQNGFDLRLFYQASSSSCSNVWAKEVPCVFVMRCDAYGKLPVHKGSPMLQSIGLLEDDGKQCCGMR